MKETLILALETAGKELLEQFGKNPDIRVKESQSSIVTKADLKSDSLIISLIREHFHSHNIISEESGFSNMNSRSTSLSWPDSWTLRSKSSCSRVIPGRGRLFVTVMDSKVALSQKKEGMSLISFEVPMGSTASQAASSSKVIGECHSLTIRSVSSA